eukprot:403354614
MEKVQRKKAYITSFAHCMLSVFTAPLLTINTSLQQSIPNNAKFITNFQLDIDKKSAGQKLKERTLTAGGQRNETSRFAQLNFFNRNKANVAKLNQQIGMALPYEAPVYRSYFEAYLGLYKQGLRGFYKGNGIRCLHIVLFHKLNTDLTIFTEQKFPQQVKQLKQIPMVQEFALSCMVDFMLQPLHVAEARFVMQNRRRNFSVYQSLGDFFKKSWSEMFRGIMMHIPRNICIAMTGLKLKNDMDIYTYYAQSIFFQSLAYPFLTIQRRLECQSKLGYGLLKNDEYKGFFNAVKKIYSQEGFLAFYRGYFAYMLAIMFWMSVLPQTTDFMMNRVPLLNEMISGQKNKETNSKAQYSPYGNLDDDDEDDD